MKILIVAMALILLCSGCKTVGLSTRSDFVLKYYIILCDDEKLKK